MEAIAIYRSLVRKASTCLLALACIFSTAKALVEKREESNPNLFGLGELARAGLVGFHGQVRFLVSLVDPGQLHVDLRASRRFPLWLTFLVILAFLLFVLPSCLPHEPLQLSIASSGLDLTTAHKR